MTRKTFGRAALVIAAGLLLFTAAPVRAAGEAAVEKAEASEKPLALTKASKTRTKKVSRARKAAKIAALKAAKRKAAAAAAIPNPEIPSAVANANAQMPATDARGQASMTDAPPPLEAAAAEQLSELGKSLTSPAVADEPLRIAQLVVSDPPQTVRPVVAPEAPRPATQASAAASNDAWAQSSLIGKIFIAFGGMLTLASAARMLVA